MSARRAVGETRASGNLFVALPVEGEALAGAARVLSTATALIPGVRWARPEGLHLTLHFLGPVPADREAGVLAALRPVAAVRAPLDLRLGGLGAFPSAGDARVLWMGVLEGSDALAELAGACRGVLEEGDRGAGGAGAFRPHCTLGRPRGWDAQRRAAWSSLAGPDQPGWTATRVRLLRSISRAGGSVFEERGAVPLLR